MAVTKIEWADFTFNPWFGCTKVSPGCDHCYAETLMATRYGRVQWGAGKPRVRSSEETWKGPVRWNKAYQRELARAQDAILAFPPVRPRVFCASLADVFDNEAPAQWRGELWSLIRSTPGLDWMLLTKRIGNVRGMLPADWGDGYEHVRLGITVVNQEEVDRDIPKLLSVPARVRFLSIEPMLGPIDLDATPLGVGGVLLHGADPAIDWVIVGGETGVGARPIHPDWVRSVRDQCQAASVPFFFKQWGQHSVEYDRDRDDPDYQRCNQIASQPGRWINLAGGHGFNGQRVHFARQVGKRAAGRLLDGREWNETP